jgi:hypothetical protein
MTRLMTQFERPWATVSNTRAHDVRHVVQLDGVACAEDAAERVLLPRESGMSGTPRTSG